MKTHDKNGDKERIKRDTEEAKLIFPQLERCKKCGHSFVVTCGYCENKDYQEFKENKMDIKHNGLD